MNVTKRYGNITAIKNLSLKINDGEYVCVLGPTGSGKTTLLKLVAGIVKPDSGEIYVDGRLVNDVLPQERNVAYVPQYYALFPHMSVIDNVAFGPLSRGFSREEAYRVSMQMLEMTRLAWRANSFPHELSGGMQQRLALARGLASGARILLLDEPLGALDARLRVELRYKLRGMAKENKLTTIHVTHDQEEAMSIADRIVVMRAGEIVEVGTPIELYMRPKSLFTANFVGEANFLIGDFVGKEDEYVKIDVGEKVLYSKCKVNPEDGKVVAVIRPEFVVMKRTGLPREAWRGIIEGRVFLGGSVRFEVRMENDVMMAVKKPLLSEALRFEVRDHVALILPREFLLVYPYPKEGLEKAISME